MRIPDSLATLVDYGIVQDVVRPLMSGKEAQIYLVVSGGQYCVAKIYKEAQNRSFKHRAEYTEGRKVRNTRDQRAIANRSKHGRAQDEAAWRSTEVDMIRRLHSAGVRVPTPLHFIDGVLLMELIVDADGNPAPRLADLVFDPASAQAMYDRLLREVLKMLCAGVVHGDLSDFNVLIGADGPVIIDFPQSVDTAHNSSARRLLLRDVDNLHRFLSQFAPHARRLPFAEEMWELFQQNAITPDTRLTGRYRPSERRANTGAVLDLIQDANYDERKRRESLGLRGGPPVDGGARYGGQGQHQPRGGGPQGSYQGRPPHRGPSFPRQPSGQTNANVGNASSNANANGPANGYGPRPGGPPNGSARSDQGRNGPPRNHPRSGPSRGGPPPDRRQPPQGGRQGQNGAQNGNGNGNGAPPQHAGPRGHRSGGHDGRRDEGRPVEVIVVRRPTPPR